MQQTSESQDTTELLESLLICSSGQSCEPIHQVHPGIPSPAVLVLTATRKESSSGNWRRVSDVVEEAEVMDRSCE